MDQPPSRLRATRLLAFVIALAVLGGGTAQARAAPLKGMPQAGVAVNPIRPGLDLTAFDAQLDTVKATGAQFVRTVLDWRWVEPQALGVHDDAFLATADAAMASAAQRGLKVILTVDGTPCYESSAPDEIKGDCSTQDEQYLAARYPPTDLTSFAPLAAFLAARYAPMLAGIELWNEPDQANELWWAGPDKAQRYAELTRAAYPAIKAVAPEVPVLAGAIVGSDGTFLDALYANGFKGTYDLLSVHYYDLVLGAIRAIRTAELKAGDHAPLWLGEYGWTSCLTKTVTFEGGHNCVTAHDQAQDTLDLLRSLRHTSYVKGASLYTIQDDPSQHFGLLDERDRPKPVLAALKTALTKPGKPSPITFTLTRRGGQVVVKGHGPVGDFYRLIASKGTTPRYTATLQTDRHNRFSLTLPKAVGVHRVRVRVYEYWLGGGTTETLR